jgi:hypothetical protein
VADERVVRMAEGRDIRGQIRAVPEKKGPPEAHSCMVAGEETTAVREAQPRNSSGSLTS